MLLHSKEVDPLTPYESKKQSQLASSIGVSSSYLSLILSGKRTPSLHVFKRLADQLGCSMESLYFALERRKLLL